MEWRAFFFYILLWGGRFSTAAVTLFPLALKADKESVKEYPLATWAVSWVEGFGFRTVFVLAALGLVCKLVSSWIGPPWKRTAMKKILNDARGYLFDRTKVLNDDQHHHRITIYRHRRWCWPWICCGAKFFSPWGEGRSPWSGWLIPYIRTGHTTQKVRSRFLAPDDASAGQGIAGRTWAKQTAYTLDNLPDLTEASSEADIASYALATNMPKEWVYRKVYERKSSGIYRSLCGIPIVVKSEPWGVMVLDSVRPDSIAKTSQDQHGQLQFILGKLLEV